MSPATAAQYVLVVEDDPALRELYRSTLTLAGYSVVAVEDGIDALRRVERRRPDALVLDLALPRKSGRDVKRELRSNPETRDIPIVIVSHRRALQRGISEGRSGVRSASRYEAI
jgi:CheY-like chemotaxis protein